MNQRITEPRRYRQPDDKAEISSPRVATAAPRRPFLRPRLASLQVPVLPTLLTLGNGVCGFASACYAVHATPTDRDSLFVAGWLVFAAMVFDTLDGGMARLMRQTSRFGAELESLCDAISFGAAPAFILIQIAPAYDSRLLWVIAAVYLACTMLRLARFNVQTQSDDQHHSFTGLPSPAAGATVASLAMVIAMEPSQTLPGLIRNWLPSHAAILPQLHNAVPVIAVVVAALMVSRVRYPHLVSQMVHGKRHVGHLLQVLFAVVAFIALGVWAAPLVLGTYIATAPLQAVWQLWQRPAQAAGRQAVLPRPVHSPRGNEVRSVADYTNPALPPRDNPAQEEARRIR
jgi:CDP-diacylglycerol--serine O-phosphatidyltransferase